DGTVERQGGEHRDSGPAPSHRSISGARTMPRRSVPQGPHRINSGRRMFGNTSDNDPVDACVPARSGLVLTQIRTPASGDIRPPEMIRSPVTLHHPSLSFRDA